MNIHSHYEALSVMRTAPPEVIRAAYKALSQTWHPDRNNSPDAPDAMYAINVAYAQLGDEKLRFEYDQWLEAEELKWTLRHPSIQPGYVEPAKPVAPVEPKKSGCFELDEAKFTAAMKRARKMSPKNDHPYVRLFRYVFR